MIKFCECGEIKSEPYMQSPQSNVIQFHDFISKYLLFIKSSITF